MIEFYTLGLVDLLDREDGHHILSVLAQPKRVAFLTYLAIASPRALHRRDTLLGIFWPDSSDKRARNALSQTVFVLRRALGQQLFTMNGEAGVGLDPDHLWCDVWEFEAALASGEKEEALDLYRGNFLDGFFLSGCLEFERWADSERGRLRDLARGAVLSLSQEMESAGNPVGAVGWLRRAREWAVYDELVLRRQVELLLALGDRSGAVREYESFARRLSVDLGMEPSKEAQSLLDKPPEMARAWQSAGAPEGSTLRPMLPAPGLDPVGGRRFSLPQTAAIALLAAVIGIGASLSAPRLWSAATSTFGPVPAQTESSQNVVVLPLENATGDPTLDPLGQTAADEIVQELATTGLVRVGPVAAPGGASGESESQVAGPGEAAARLWPLRDAAYVVTGSFSDRNGSLAYQARILEAESGSIVAAVDTVMGSLADPSAATERLKRHVAGALAMVLDPRLSGLTNVASHPRSFEAYQLVADGFDLDYRAMRAGLEGIGPLTESSAQAFLQAAALDSAFTLPRILALGEVLAPPELGAQLRVLQPRRDELPRWERAMFDYYLAMNAQDAVGRYEAMRRVVDISPAPDWTVRLASSALRLNRPQEALELLRPLESDHAWLKDHPGYWLPLVDAKLMLGEYEAALKDIERVQARTLEYIDLIPREVEALARMGRTEEAVARSIQYLHSTGDRAEHALWTWLPLVLRGAGLDDEAKYVAEVSVASLRGMEEVAYPHLLATALVQAGRYDEARQELARFGDFRDFEDRRYRAFALLAYMAAREGDAEEATRLSEMARAASEAVGEHYAKWGAMSPVEVAAQLGDRGGAVRLLLEVYELGISKGSWVLTRWDLTPLYGYQPFEDLMRPKG